MYCAKSVNVKEQRMVKISEALNYGVPHNPIIVLGHKTPDIIAIRETYRPINGSFTLSFCPEYVFHRAHSFLHSGATVTLLFRKTSYPLSAAMKNKQIWNLWDWNSDVIFHCNSKIQHVVCFVPTTQHTLQRTNIVTLKQNWDSSFALRWTFVLQTVYTLLLCSGWKKAVTTPKAYVRHALVKWDLSAKFEHEWAYGLP